MKGKVLLGESPPPKTDWPRVLSWAKTMSATGEDVNAAQREIKIYDYYYKNYALLQTLSPALHCPLCAGEPELLVKGSLAVMEQELGGRRAYGRLAGSVCQ